MRTLRALLLGILLAAMVALPNLALAADGTVTVQPGDTLTSIAARTGTTVDALAAANGIASPNLIFVGQTLHIPGGGSQAPARPAYAPANGSNYTVQPGDYLSVIAVKYGVSQDALMAANGIS